MVNMTSCSDLKEETDEEGGNKKTFLGEMDKIRGYAHTLDLRAHLQLAERDTPAYSASLHNT